MNLDINKLKESEPLYVVGHKRPDVDTIVSSYLLSNILNSFGIRSYPCILDEGYDIDAYNKKIIEDYLVFNPIVIKKDEIKKYNFVLVDHNDPIQSLGINTNIVLCIDHHKNSSNISNILLGKWCANSLFIYKLFKDKYSFSDDEKKLIMIAVFADTLFLKTDRYKKEDEELVKELGLNLDNNDLLKKYFVETDLSWGINNYIKTSDRDFSYEGVSFSSSVVQMLSCTDELITKYKNAVVEKDDNHLGILRDLINNKTYAFFKSDNYIKVFEYDLVVSRTTVIPDVISYIIELKNKDTDR